MSARRSPNESADVLAKCAAAAAHELVGLARTEPVTYDVVAYADHLGTVHHPSDAKPLLTRCGRIALSRLRKVVLSADDRVCDGCAGASPLMREGALRRRRGA